MRPVRTLPLSEAGVTPPIPLDINQAPFSVGVAVALTNTPNLTYTVQHTFDDVFAENFNPATATWFPNASLTDKTSSSDGNYSYPVRAIRLNITLYTAGTATMTVIQAGMPGR